MLHAEQIKHSVEAFAHGTDIFVAGVSVAPGNRIRVLVDRLQGPLTMKDCVNIHRHIESTLDRETVDFELEVGSPGMGEPFIHPLQYNKNVGRSVRITLTDGTAIQGLLQAIEDSVLTLLPEAPRKGKAKAAPITTSEPVQINISTIKETRKVITFK